MENKKLAQRITSIIYFLIPVSFLPFLKDNFLIKNYLFFILVVILSFIEKPDFSIKIKKGIFLFLTLMLISIFFSSNLRIALFNFSKYFVFYISVFYLSTLDIRKIFRAIFFSSIFVFLYGFLQLFGFDFINWQDDFSKRIFSFLGNPNFFGSYLTSILPVYFYLFEKERKKIYLIFFVFDFFLLLFTKTRGSIIAAIFTLLFLFYFSFKNNFYSKKFLKVFTFSVILLSLIFVVNGFFKINLKESSIKERFFKWEVAFSIFKSNPVFGCGIGNVKTNFALYQADVREKFKIKLKSTSESKIHNDFFQILAELGIFGFFSFFYLLIQFFKNSSYLKDKILSATIISGVSGILINSISNFPLQLPSSLSIFVLYLSFSGSGEKFYSKKTLEIFLRYFILLIFLFILLPELIADYFRKKGDDFYKLKNYKRAVFYYEKAHKISPINGKILYELGMSYIKLKDYDSAIRSFEEGIKIRNYGELYNDLGNAYYLKKDYENALKFWKIALKLGLPQEEAYKNLKRNLKLIEKRL